MEGDVGKHITEVCRDNAWDKYNWWDNAKEPAMSFLSARHLRNTHISGVETINSEKIFYLTR
jgi:hypothetical protein